MTEIKIVRGDRKFVLDFTIYDADGLIVNLTGCETVKLKYKNYEDGTVGEIIGSVVGDPANGEVQFLVEDQFANVTGEFKAEIEITYTSGKIITAPGLVIKVIPDIR